MHNLVIADKSCLIVLFQINSLDWLRELYEEVTITVEVEQEFEGKLPDWIKIKEVKDKMRQEILQLSLDKGEASAIALSLENEHSLLLIDERKGRRIANELGLKFTGTLGIIIKAKEQGIISSIAKEIEKLKSHHFWLSEKLIKQILEKYDD